ncbi:MAG: hypothetical protein GY946_15155 [bacterium]|nr:hypothetical protein [bacterium]
MSDFRVVVLADDFEVEVDWSDEKQCWAASERGHGAGLANPWVGGQSLAEGHLQALRAFFLVEGVSNKVLARFSPAELVVAHQSQVRAARLHCTPCLKKGCEEHWYVARFEEEEKRWLLHGRDCEFSWYRGRPLTNELLDAIGDPVWGEALLRL